MESESTIPLFTILSTCKGGGYRYCRTDPPHPKRNKMGLYPLHRVIAENKLGRLLNPGEVAHHDDEVKSNDAVGNIVPMDGAEHSRMHALKRSPKPIECRCSICGAVFFLKPYQYRLRAKRTGAEKMTCGRACGYKRAQLTLRA